MREETDKDDEEGVVSDEDGLTYEGSIKGMLDQTCALCHNAFSPSADLDLSSYDAIMSHSGIVIVGDAESSWIVVRQTEEQPHYGQLTPEQLEVLIEWINSGASE